MHMYYAGLGVTYGNLLHSLEELLRQLVNFASCNFSSVDGILSPASLQEM